MTYFKKKNIFFFKGTRVKLWNEYKEFTKIPKVVHGAKSGVLKLEKSKEPVEYDSLLEKDILIDLDNSNFIREIKTQSLEIPFKAKFGPKIRTYIPDIQLLLHGGAIVIIEVKPFQEMVNSTVLRKSDALRSYCKENGYGHAIVDMKNSEYYTFEDLKKEKVSEDIQKRFIDFVAEREKVSFVECGTFKKEYDINDKQICYIIWKNKKKIAYKQHKIIFKKSWVGRNIKETKDSLKLE